MLREQIWKLEREKKGPAYKKTCQSIPIQETSKKKTAMNASKKATTILSQVYSIKPKEARSYTTVTATKPV